MRRKLFCILCIVCMLACVAAAPGYAEDGTDIGEVILNWYTMATTAASQEVMEEVSLAVIPSMPEGSSLHVNDHQDESLVIKEYVLETKADITSWAWDEHSAATRIMNDLFEMATFSLASGRFSPIDIAGFSAAMTNGSLSLVPFASYYRCEEIDEGTRFEICPFFIVKEGGMLDKSIYISFRVMDQSGEGEANTLQWLVTDQNTVGGFIVDMLKCGAELSEQDGNNLNYWLSAHGLI